MNKEKNLTLLNALLEINCERIEGYKLVMKEGGDHDLNQLLLELIETSELCRSELMQEIINQESSPRKGILITGKFLRLQMDLGQDLIRNKNTILNICKNADDIIVNRYKQALRNNLDHMTAEQQNMLNMHYAFLKHDREKLISRLTRAMV